jgi:hypothetical protein
VKGEGHAFLAALEQEPLDRLIVAFLILEGNEANNNKRQYNAMTGQAFACPVPAGPGRRREAEKR